ncbi:MAG: FAD-binding oxidoreductase [Halioglobus sp.]
MRGPLLSWGRYPNIPQLAHSVQWPEELAPARDKIFSETGEGALAFGMGRSYGDSCLAQSDQVIAMSGMGRMLAADWTRGVVKAQAGMTLDDLLRLALPAGWFLPVTPGTRFVTLGGAVANDVHGKNHHVRGTFGCHVRRFELVRSDEGLVECSPQQRPELFAATIGGLGMTGIVQSVEVQLQRVSSSLIDQRCIRFGNLDEFFAISAEHDSQHEYAVSWIDCLAVGDKLGRGHYIAADHASEGGLELAANAKLSVPFDPPVSLVNSLTLKPFNSLYYHRQRVKEVCSRTSYAPFFYPLDSVQHWNRIYGRKGFQQYQCVVPHQDGRNLIRAIIDQIAHSGTGSFLAVLKQFGDVESPGLLSFPMPGITLALDFPHSDKNSSLFQRLDALVHEAGGRLYPAKDAHMSAAHFQQAYPAWQEVEARRDPQLLSRFWKRVTQ